MVTEIKTKKLSEYSLLFLFRYYKECKDDIVLAEIFRRTSGEIFDLIQSKSGYRDNPSNMVLIVFRMMKELLREHDSEKDVQNYLEKIVNGCINIYSN